jgi:uncharacterized protein YxeA
MKYILRILLFVVFGFVAYGYYYKNNGSDQGDKWIGIGILILALVLMPLFIFHRYKNKNLNDYIFKIDDKKKEDTENQ